MFLLLERCCLCFFRPIWVGCLDCLLWSKWFPCFVLPLLVFVVVASAHCSSSLFFGRFCSFDFLLGPGWIMKFFGEFEVTMVIGLCCGESDTRFIASTVSELLHESWSVLINDDFFFCCCRLLACSSFVCARAACFDLISNCDNF